MNKDTLIRVTNSTDKLLLLYCYIIDETYLFSHLCQYRYGLSPYVWNIYSADVEWRFLQVSTHSLLLMLSLNSSIYLRSSLESVVLSMTKWGMVTSPTVSDLSISYLNSPSLGFVCRSCSLPHVTFKIVASCESGPLSIHKASLCPGNFLHSEVFCLILILPPAWLWLVSTWCIFYILFFWPIPMTSQVEHSKTIFFYHC